MSFLNQTDPEISHRPVPLTVASDAVRRNLIPYAHRGTCACLLLCQARGGGYIASNRSRMPPRRSLRPVKLRLPGYRIKSAGGQLPLPLRVGILRNRSRGGSAPERVDAP